MLNLDFLILLAIFIEGIDTYVSFSKKHPELLQEIPEMKERFYNKLEEFKKSGYAAKGKINPESMEGLYEFQNLDWCVGENIEKVKSYIHSLMSRKIISKTAAFVRYCLLVLPSMDKILQLRAIF